MTDKLTLLHFDAATGIETIRDLTEDEISDLETAKSLGDQRREQEESKVAARQSALGKLAALGLTEEEIAAL